MALNKLEIKNHPILGNQSLDFVNPETGKPYGTIAFVGENACGKTTALNLLFEYEKTEFIAKNDDKDISPRIFLFVRQNSIYAQSQAELVKSISGEEVNPVYSMGSKIFESPNAIYRNCALSQPEKLKKILSIFNDERLLELGTKSSFLKITCGGDALNKIKENNNSLDISSFSSGQQEMLIKLATLEKTLFNVDCVLLDEPETSLHPRWQRTIIKTIKEMLKNDEGCPQLFVATHSEKVLESLVNMEDVLIYRFSKKDGHISIKPVNYLNLTLPKTTFAELDYAIFNIDTYDYHDQLFSYYCDLCGSDSISFIDKEIKNSEEYGPQMFKKWEGTKKVWNRKTNRQEIVPSITATLPVYIRNYFHHPKDGKEPSEEELHCSIVFLQNLINLKK